MDGDDRLLARLGRHDPVPADVRAAARASLAWHDIDAQLAALTADSAAEALPGHVRAQTQPRLLTFATDHLTIELEVIAGPGSVTLVGQLIPAVAATVTAEYTGGVLDSTADRWGRFHLPGLPTGPVRLRCTVGSGRTRTDWFLTP